MHTWFLSRGAQALCYQVWGYKRKRHGYRVLSPPGLTLLLRLPDPYPQHRLIPHTPRMEPQIRYAKTSDGLSVAYSSIGVAYPLVLTQGWITHLKIMLEHEETRHTFDEYARHFRVVRYDKRGVGLSDRNIDDFSVESRLKDLEAVVDDAGLERFALYGFSEGGPVAITYAVRHPERVSHLVLHGTFAFGEDVYTRSTIQPLADFVRTNWGLASEAVTAAFTGNLATVKNALNQITTFTPNTDGTLASVKDALLHTTSFGYNDLPPEN